MRQDNMQRDRTTDLGVVRINNDVIAAIAYIASMEVKGVSRMGGGIGKTLQDMLVHRPAAKGVKVQASESDVRLTISVIVDYGVDIGRVADEVQENVKRAVEKMTGLMLSQVDVIVEGVDTQVVSRKSKT